jgi:hypothetical protein
MSRTNKIISLPPGSEFRLRTEYVDRSGNLDTRPGRLRLQSRETRTTTKWIIV